MLKINHNAQSQSGNSLIGMLMIITISGLLISASYKLVVSALYNSQQIRVTAQQDSKLLYAEGVILQALTGLNSHRLSQGIRIQNAELRLRNGELVSIHSGPSRLHPKSNSQTITIINLRSSKFSYLEELSLVANNRLVAKACFDEEIAEIDSVLGLSVDGSSELEVIDKSISGSTGCYTLLLQQRPSLLFDHIPLASVRSVAPIAANRTIYLANDGQLRVLDLVGDQILTNQPFAADFSRFTVKSSLLGGQLLAFYLKLELENGRNASFNWLSQLGRSEHLSILLNRQSN